MGLSPAIGYTAGLGKLTVLSSIGQPLVGEIELVSVRKEEISTLAARLAPPDAYKNANISFSPALVGARVSVQKRPSGQLYVRVTSTRPVDEPFIELLVELSWNTGRLVREYTALVDPPGFAPVPAATPVAAPETRPAPAVPVAPAAPRTAAPAPAPAPSGTAAATYGPVQSGDTLRRIAAGVKPQGVSLDQMLVGIFRSNPDAFINNNMNLLRAGRILRIPDANELAQLGPAEAEKEIRLQASDWNAYRQRASAVVPEIQTGAPLTAAGKITTKVDEPGSAAQTPAKEVVKVSKGAPGKEGGAADKDMQERIRSLEEEATAREKTLKDSNDRIASLEKTIKDMQRLLELKGVAVPPPVKAPGDAPALAAAPNVGAEAVKPPVEGAEPGAKTAAEAPIPPALDAVPAEKPAVVAEPKPEPKPEQKPPEVPPPAPVIEQAWWEDPMLVGGGLLALGVLGGGAYALSRRRRDKQTSAVEAEPTFKAPLGMDETQQQTAMPAALTPVVASATSEMPTSGAVVAADDVDPIAEADVYIAYGRDAQAEEILREALAREPGREEIKLKLLEIYAARKSKNDFNPLAADLHSATGGKGDAWMRAAALGYALDSDNPLYAAGKDSTIESPVGVATDVNLDFDLDMVSAAGAPTTITDVPLDAGDDNIKTTILSPERMEALKAEGAAMAAKLTDSQSIVPDFDLGADMLAAPKTDVNLEPMAPAGPITDVNLALPAVAGTDSNVIDFEFDPGKTMKIEPEAAAAFAPDRTIAMSPQNQEKARDLGIEIDLGALDATSGSMPIDIAAEPPKAERTADLSFDFQLPGEPSAATPEIEVPPTDIRLDVPEFKPAETATMDFSLDTVSLDLGDDKKVVEQAPVRDDHWYDVQTKFDLAKAYQEMGDKDGAREILSEVIKEGDAQQQAEATELMAKLG